MCFTDPSSFPQNITVTALSSTEIQVNWADVAGIDQNGDLTQYEVFYRSTLHFCNESVLVNNETFSVNITGLEEFVVYNVSVRAYTSVGPGPFSDVVMEQTEEAG